MDDVEPPADPEALPTDGVEPEADDEARHADGETPADDERAVPADRTAQTTSGRSTGPRWVSSADGLRIAVHERHPEAAETVVLVHGYPDDHRVWDPVAEILAPRFHVVTYDVRGAGASGIPDGIAGYRLDRLAEDVAAVLDATTTGDRPVHLVGHDWGSIQGWHFVCDDRLSERFGSFTSISGPQLDAVAGWFRRRGDAPLSLATVAAQALKSWYVGVFQIPGLAPAFWRSPVARRSWPRVLQMIEGVPPDRLPDDERVAGTQIDGAHGVGLYRANMPSALRHPRPARTAVPVQVVVPLGDRYVSPAMAECARTVADDVHVVRVDGGHWLPLCDPDLVATLVTEHIDRHR